MPEYMFRCSPCGTVTTVFRHISTEGEIDPPICERCALPMFRDYAIGGVIFKGDGWGSKG